ncbi:hypothetical protein ACFXAF_35795 [Kitasatospora sp. NPDC059463]|uniref:hypothetical protein n=1 Tax=unclassified Kitasatospora TaxID=2633591 RepID=UPI0036BB5152
MIAAVARFVITPDPRPHQHRGNDIVDHAEILRALAPLPDGITTGRQQLARRADVLITAALESGGIRSDTYRGVRVQVVLRASGAQLGANLFDFDEHATVPRPGFVHTLRDLARIDGDGELNPGPLREAVARYTALLTDTSPEPAPAAGRTESRVRGVQRGTRTGSAQPLRAPTASTATPATQRATAARGR